MGHWWMGYPASAPLQSDGDTRNAPSVFLADAEERGGARRGERRLPVPAFQEGQHGLATTPANVQRGAQERAASTHVFVAHAIPPALRVRVTSVQCAPADRTDHLFWEWVTAFDRPLLDSGHAPPTTAWRLRRRFGHGAEVACEAGVTCIAIRPEARVVARIGVLAVVPDPPIECGRRLRGPR